MANGLMRLLLLVSVTSLAGCLSMKPIAIEETEAAIVADVCRAWKPVTYSSRDTEQTQNEARANNAARDAYCGVVP